MKLNKFAKISIITTIIGGIILIENFIFLSKNPQLFAIINMIAAIIILGIPLMYKYNEYKKIKKIESIFPKYLRDIAESISAGMTLPQAIRSVTKNDYDVLTPYVNEINAKISWGVPFEKVFNNFANKIGTPLMKRNVQSIIETHRSGGSMDTVLRAAAESLQELEKIKRERSASIYSQMINGYMIFVVFLGVMIGMSSMLIPAFRFEETGMGDMRAVFTEIFRSLIIIQGFFAGLSIGKMAEGTIIAGIKHSIVLVVFGYSAFLLLG
ncbi:MAG: type II secretion system F family protein [Candidatus Aenigmatarchaeota archaeon]